MICIENNWHIRGRERMGELGLNYADFAGPLNVSAAAVGHYFTGRNDPSPGQLIEISRILRCSTDWLLTGNDSAPVSQAVVDYGERIANLSQADRLLLLEFMRRLSD